MLTRFHRSSQAFMSGKLKVKGNSALSLVTSANQLVTTLIFRYSHVGYQARHRSQGEPGQTLSYSIPASLCLYHHIEDDQLAVSLLDLERRSIASVI